jgi:hypothetical protein
MSASRAVRTRGPCPTVPSRSLSLEALRACWLAIFTVDPPAKPRGKTVTCRCHAHSQSHMLLWSQ